MKHNGLGLFVLIGALTLTIFWIRPGGAAAGQPPPPQLPATDSYEPDNEWWDATNLSPGSYGAAHSLSPAGDVDWVKLTVLSGQWSADIVADKTVAAGAIKMTLFSENLTFLDTSIANGNGAIIARECAIDPLPGGVYYVKIEEYSSTEISAYHIVWDDYEDCSQRSDLQPHTRAEEGYEYPVVPNSIKNTKTVDSTLYAGKTTYFDWFFINNGPGWPPGNYYSRVWVDGHLAVEQKENPIGQGSVGGRTDSGFTVPSPGWHTVYFEVDSDNDVPERDELNNTWEMDFYWTPVNGWWAEFYNNEELQGDPVLVRDDPAIDFDWGGGAPGPGVNADHFSARWTRKVYFDAGIYLFYLYHDDGVRFYINNEPLFEYWSWNVADHQVVETLSGGTHDVKFEMKEIDGVARAGLSWDRCFVLDFSATPSFGGDVYVETEPNCGDDLYLEGTIVTLWPEPYEGYRFDHWSGGASGNAIPLPVTMNGNKAITAHYEVENYTLIVNVSPSGSGEVIKDPDLAFYSYDTEVTLTAEPAEHYKFDHWSGAASGSANPVVVTIDGDETVTAHFEAACYVLADGASPSGGGWVGRNPNLPCYEPGTQVTLTATANSDFAFDHWSGDAGGNANPQIVTMNANKTVTAHFEAACYVLTTGASPSGGGWVGRNPDLPCYEPGTQVTLTATAYSGFTFNYWDGSIGGSQNPQIVTMNANKTVTAHFEAACYVLTTGASPSGGGWVGRTLDLPCYVPGTQVTLTATAYSGFTFNYWDGSIGGSQNPQIVTMNADKTVTAHFSQTCYSLTLTVNPSGSGNITATEPNCGTGRYLAGTEVTVQAQASGDYRFSQWSGAISGSVNPRTVIMDNDKDVTANFSVTCYTLSLSVTPVNGGWVQSDPQPNCDGTKYTAGTQVTLTAHPNSNHSFKQWTGSLVSFLNPRTFTMDGDKSITANFFRTDQIGYMPTITSNPSVGADCNPGPNESENNDAANEVGQPLCLNQDYHGVRQDRDDFFAIHLKVPGELVVRLTTNQGNAGVQLLLQYSNLELADHDGSLGNELQVGLPTAQPGRYYIHIITAYPDNGTYTFQISFTPSE